MDLPPVNLIAPALHLEPMNPNPSAPFSGLPGQSCLTRDSNGRTVLPDPALLVPNAAGVHWTDEELTAIYLETVRRRRRWRFWHYVKLVAILGSLFWTFLLMPLAARHAWPFD